jgi:hypothetical protein
MHTSEARNQTTCARNIANIPNYQFPINTRGADFRHVPSLRLIWPDICDGVLVDSHQLGIGGGLTTDWRALPASVSIAERVEGCTV